ncbi:MAG: ribonuclease H-like domain-containing protein [Planctomycetota bacterium]|jgi:predicted PolB exonuclease-like 3'-5' exonuclease
MIAWDIETGPLPLEEIPPFDRESVSMGGLVDPVKKLAKKEEAEKKYYERAALSAVTGQVLAIGVRESPKVGMIKNEIIGDGFCREEDILSVFWQLFLKWHESSIFVGWNTTGFDLPFLVRRSWMRQVAVPPQVYAWNGRFHSCFVDLLERWRCGDRQMKGKLDAVAKIFGIDGKLEGVTGADFSRLWEADKDRAIAYLKQDLQVTLRLAERMQVS